MFFLVSLVAARHTSININGSTFTNIININGLKEAVCTLNNIKSSTRVTQNKPTAPYALSCLSFKGIQHPGGTYNGGAVSIYSTAEVIMENLVFEDDISDYYGGGAYFQSVQYVTIQNNSFSRCEALSYTGGSLCFYYLTKATISESHFSASYAKGDGGAIFGDSSMSIDTTTFSDCKASGNGGGVYIKNTGEIVMEFSKNTFTKCGSVSHGSSIYVESTTLTYASNDNTFSDSVGGPSGAVYIWSSLKISGSLPVLLNDAYVNCRTSGTGIGGAVQLNVQLANLANLKVVKCTFDRCSASNSGAIRFKITGELALKSNIHVYGCCFKNCSAKNALCIGLISSPAVQVALTISNQDSTKTTFQSLTGTEISYAIVAEILSVYISNCDFSQLKSVSAINTSIKCQYITLSQCGFDECKPIGNLIYSLDLKSFNLENSIFHNCKNCIQITSEIMTISSVTFSDIDVSTLTSRLIGEGIAINDLNILNSKEDMVFYANFLTLLNSRFINYTKKIYIYGNSFFSIDYRIVTIDNLTTLNAPMFSITTSILNVEMMNCQASFLGPSTLILFMSGAKNTEITNCTFYCQNNDALIFNGGNASMLSCNVYGEGSLIQCVTTRYPLTLQNCTFVSKNRKVFNVVEPYGKVILVSYSNCINKPFNDTFAFVGAVSVFDDKNVPIDRFYNRNNRCMDESPSTPQFSYSSLFEHTEQFSFSLEPEIERVVSSSDFSNDLTIPSSLFNKEEPSSLNIEHSLESQTQTHLLSLILNPTEPKGGEASYLISSTGLTDIHISKTQMNSINEEEEFSQTQFKENLPISIDRADVHSSNTMTHSTKETISHTSESAKGSFTSSKMEREGDISQTQLKENLPVSIDKTDIHLSKTLMSSINEKEKEEDFSQTQLKESLTKTSNETEKEGKISQTQHAENPTIYIDRTDIHSSKAMIHSNKETMSHISESAKGSITSTKIEYEFDISQTQIKENGTVSKEKASIDLSMAIIHSSKEKMSHNIENIKESSMTVAKENEKQKPLIKTEILLNSYQQTHKEGAMTSNEISKLLIDSSNLNTKVMDKSSDLLNEQVNVIAEKPSQISTEIIAGAAAGGCVFIIICVVVICLIVKKKSRQSDEDEDPMDVETDLETTISVDSFTDDYGTSYVTQENTNTMWTAGQGDNEFGLLIEDMFESDDE